MRCVITDARFEALCDLFRSQSEEFGEGGGAFCVYRAGRPIFELCLGSAAEGTPWQADTRAVLMSASKALAATAVAVLVDRGLVDLDVPLFRYWPEVAASSSEITLRHVLSHSAGVITVRDYPQLLSLDGTGWENCDRIVQALARTPPVWPPGSRHGYHALTYGWLLGEVVRRVDGRTLGELFREEIARPLGIDAAIGTPVSDQSRVARVLPIRSLPLPPEVATQVEPILQGGRDPDTWLGQSLFAAGGEGVMDVLHVLMNRASVLAAEVPAANATATAHGLARLFAMLAGGGVLDGCRVLSAETVQMFRTEQWSGVDAITGAPMRWGLGFQLNLEGYWGAFGPTPASFGHAGAGGQVGFADPERNLSMGLVRNHLSLVPTFSMRLFRQVYEILD